MVSTYFELLLGPQPCPDVEHDLQEATISGSVSPNDVQIARIFSHIPVVYERQFHTYSDINRTHRPSNIGSTATSNLDSVVYSTWEARISIMLRIVRPCLLRVPRNGQRLVRFFEVRDLFWSQFDIERAYLRDQLALEANQRRALS